MVLNFNSFAFFQSLQTQEDHPPTELIMRFLIGLCGIIVIGAIVVLILAAQQRYM